MALFARQSCRQLCAALLLSCLFAGIAPAQQWGKLAPFPEPSEELYGITARGKLYVFGGQQLGWKSLGMVYEYDPATDQWGAIGAPMPTARSGGAWGVYQGRIYVAGGEGRTYQFSAAFKAVEAYDPAANAWMVLPPMQVQRHGLAGGVIGNRLHLVSGVVQSQSPVPGTNIATDVHEVLALDAGGN